MSKNKNKSSQKDVKSNKINNPKEDKEMDLNNEQKEVTTNDEKDTSTIMENENIEEVKTDIQNEQTSNEVATVATENDVTNNIKNTQQTNGELPFICTEITDINEKGEEIILQVIETEIEGTPYKAIIPYQKCFKGKRNLLFHYELNKSGNFDYTLISDCPIFFTKRIENIDTDRTKMEVAFFKNGRWIKKVVPTEILYNKPTDLSQYGLKITSSNAKYFKEYITDFELHNEIPIVNTIDRLGWRNNYKEFIPYSEILQLDNPELLENYTESGTLEEWCNAISKYRTNHIFRFILSSAFSAPLIPILNERPFTVYNFAPSRSGKTALLNVAISVFGDPRKLITTFNSTTVGIEKLLQLNNHLPLAIDEKQIAEVQNFLEKVIFMASSQQGRVRGNKYGGLAPQTRFSNIPLATGEEPFTKTSSTTGIGTRCLEIEGKPFENSKQAQEMYKATSKYYGTAGRTYIKELIINYSDNSYQELESKLEELKNILEEKSDSNVSSYISAVAIVTLADILVGKHIFNEANEELSIKVGIQILNSLARAEDIDVTEKCYDTLKSYIIANHHRFGKYVLPTLQESPDDDVRNYASVPLGVYEDGTYYMFIHEVENFMIKNKFNYRKMMKEFAERGYIRPSLKEDGSLKSTSVQKKYHNHNTRFYAFEIEEIVKATELTPSPSPFGNKEDKKETKKDNTSLFTSKQMNYKMGEF